MFSFFKKKTSLRELIPDGYVDIHSHLLCGIDDGAKTIEDSRFIIESMLDLGFVQVVTTPHTTPLIWENTKEGILKKYAEVKKTLPNLTQKIALRAASEYMMDDSFLKRMQEEPLLTIKENYVLVEMSYINPPIQLFDILFELKSNGYQIVLAHPERYNFYHQNTEVYKKLKKSGCFFQLNLLSATGYYGEHVLKAANYLLDQNMIDFTGSDIHHKKHIAGFESNVKVKNIQNFQAAMRRNSEFRI